MVVELGGLARGLVVLAQLALVGLDLLGECLLEVELARQRGRELGPELVDVGAACRSPWSRSRAGADA